METICIPSHWNGSDSDYIYIYISASWYRPVHHLGLCALPMLRCSSFFAYTPNWPVALFLLLLHPPRTLYTCWDSTVRKYSHYQTPLENPSIQTHLVLLCCNKRLCIFGPNGAIQIRYYYYYFMGMEMNSHCSFSTCHMRFCLVIRELGKQWF